MIKNVLQSVIWSVHTDLAQGQGFLGLDDI